MAVRKWPVSVEEQLASRVEARLAGRSLSGFVAGELEHEALGAYLDDLDAEFGPVPQALVDRYDAVWP